MLWNCLVGIVVFSGDRALAAGRPLQRKLTLDRDTIKVNGYDLSFVLVEMVDHKKRSKVFFDFYRRVWRSPDFQSDFEDLCRRYRMLPSHNKEAFKCRKKETSAGGGSSHPPSDQR